MPYFIPIWKEAPFIRLIIPLTVGILAGYHFAHDDHPTLLIFFASFCLILVFGSLPLHLKYRFSWLSGSLLVLLLICLGILLLRVKSPMGKINGNSKPFEREGNLLVILDEPLAEKSRSLKTVATVKTLLSKDSPLPKGERMIIYLQKDSLTRILKPGHQLLIHKPLAPVSRSGNPGAFDYRSYSARQGITAQVYLKPGEFTLLPEVESDYLNAFIHDIREGVLKLLKKYIPGQTESGFAEALLIGYKDNLDRKVLEAYSNTGVIHVIAVSGLHLGIIYFLLGLMLRPLERSGRSKWAALIITLLVLWLFSLVAGAGASVMRAAFMFSTIAIGKAVNRNSSIYNNLAASAFILLCINPFWIWDVGFQLSYSAVLSIVIFYKRIYSTIYVKNRLLDLVWKLNAVTFSAQILTLPLTIYYFHQFPNYFVLANLIAVPITSMLLVAEILLCCVAAIPAFANLLGGIISWLIKLLNQFIENLNQLPCSNWNGLEISVVQVVLLYGFIGSISYWLMMKQKSALPGALLCLLIFMGVRANSFMQAARQKKIIIYNIPGKTAFDIIHGRKYIFKGDSSINADQELKSFHLNPSRSMHRISETSSMDQLQEFQNLFLFAGTSMFVYDGRLKKQVIPAVAADVWLIRRNPDLNPAIELKNSIPGVVVTDASNSSRTINSWRMACKSAGVKFHDVSSMSAYVLNLH